MPLRGEFAFVSAVQRFWSLAMNRTGLAQKRLGVCFLAKLFPHYLREDKLYRKRESYPENPPFGNMLFN
jgi:hypothetical protein